MTSPMWSTSSRVPWNALLAVTVPSTSQIGCRPRSRAASAASTTMARRAHAEDHPVPSAIERQGGVGDVVVGRRCTAGEEAGAEPAEEVVGRDVVGGDDDDSTAAAGADPVLGDGHGLGGAGARRVDLRVRTAGADEVGELRVAHRQDAEQEAAVEAVRLVVDELAEVVQPPVDLVERDVGSVELSTRRTRIGLELGPLRRDGCVGGEGIGLDRELLDARGTPMRRSRRCRRAARRAGPIARAAGYRGGSSCTA